MSFEEFLAGAVAGKPPPNDMSQPLQALWLDRSDHWDAAHRAVQDDTTAEAAWVHAYLHRKEGDVGNAGYWYSRAGRGRTAPSTPLGDECEAIARALLA